MRRIRLSLLALGCILWMPCQAVAQDGLWKCSDPDNPFRFARNDSDKDALSPPCLNWVQIRGENLEALLTLLTSEPYEDANVFMMEAATVTPHRYPRTAAGYPVPTANIYDDPEGFGVQLVSVDDAEAGSLVVYDGLGGILVETRNSEDEPWMPAVLYPSAARNFELVVHEVNIPGKMEPKVLITEPDRQ